MPHRALNFEKYAADGNYFVNAVADELNCDRNRAARTLRAVLHAIVTGISSHGNNFVKNLVGSSAVSISKKSTIPVLVVPPEAVFRKPATILYANEFEPEMGLEPGYLQVRDFAA